MGPFAIERPHPYVDPDHARGWGDNDHRFFGFSAVVAELARRGMPCVVVDPVREQIEGLRESGAAAVYGNPAEPEVLVQAHIAEADLLVVSSAEATDVPRMIETARTLNPDIRIVVRSSTEEEADAWLQAGIEAAVHPKSALADALLRAVLACARRPAAAPAASSGA